MRYGPPLHRTFLGPERFDWSFADETFGELKRLRIMPIVDLCHFGVPDWIGNFQNPDFPELFAGYARGFARRFQWVQLFTPVNEMYEHRVTPDGAAQPSGEVLGYDEITRQYYQRYGLPVMHTETNLQQGPKGNEAVCWLHKEWANVLRLRNDGIPIVGFTWFSLTDQVDWDVALRENNGTVNPLGLFDLNRDIRPVGKAYQQLISEWRDILPTQSVCLTVPLRFPNGK